MLSPCNSTLKILIPKEELLKKKGDIRLDEPKEEVKLENNDEITEILAKILSNI